MAAGLQVIDVVALVTFLSAWFCYHTVTESRRLGEISLNGLMNSRRRVWMDEMLRRDNRIFDAQIMASLQNGAAFFASTALIAIGGTLALLQAGDAAGALLSEWPLGAVASRGLWELKTIGLTTIFIHGFFKFAWSYRLFNYAAIMMGAMPPATEAEAPEAKAAAKATADLIVAAGTEFNRGQRAFFFALAYLGWFLGPAVFLVTTLLSLAVMARRQFGSAAHRAVGIYARRT